MPEHALRFGVSDGAGKRAATWVLVAARPPKNDLYLACRSLGGALKTSFHESGDWRTAYIEAAFQELVESTGPEAQDRIIVQWPRPPELAPGITLAFRIVTPWTAVVSAIKSSDATKVTWVPNAPEGKATEITILISAADTTVSGWPGKDSMGTCLVGSMPLANGDTVWAVHMVTEMSDYGSLREQIVHLYKGRSRDDLASAGILRAQLFVDHPDGSRAIHDLVGNYSAAAT